MLWPTLSCSEALVALPLLRRGLSPLSAPAVGSTALPFPLPCPLPCTSPGCVLLCPVSFLPRSVCCGVFLATHQRWRLLVHCPRGCFCFFTEHVPV